MKYIAQYGDNNCVHPGMPEIRVEFPWRITGGSVALVLADEARVKILNSPKPELNGIEGSWGSLREKLWFHDTELARRGYEHTKVEVEVLCPLWRCFRRRGAYNDPSDLQEAMNSLSYRVDELFDRITRRNRLCTDLRRKNKKLKQHQRL